MAAPTATPAASHCVASESTRDEVWCGDRRYVPESSCVSEAQGTDTGDDVPVGSTEWFVYLFCAIGCVCIAALAAGLTMGLVSIDEFDLDLLLEQKLEETESDEDVQAKIRADQRYARALQPLIANTFFHQTFGRCFCPRADPTNRHYLLVTLLIFNAASNEALPIFLDRLVPAWAAVLVSISFVLVFGEIIPSAVFTGPGQLAIAAKLAPLVKAMKLVLLPLVWPISLALDKFLPEEDDDEYSRGKLRALVRLQRNKKTTAAALTNALTKDEEDLIHGALDLFEDTAGEAKTGHETCAGPESEGIAGP